MKITVTVYLIGCAEGTSTARWLPAGASPIFGLGMLGANGLVAG